MTRHHDRASHARERKRAALLALVLLAACSDPEPQYASVRLTHEAPDVTLTGVAGGPRAAADLIIGCVGFLSEAGPDHVITIAEPMKLEVVARSVRGPVSLAIVGADGAVCDDDTGTGHAPRLALIAAGRYEIWVAARLSADARLPYELSITKNDKSRVRMGAPGGTESVASAGTSDGSVSVTVTSEPSGAEVRTTGGQVLGTTPAMFVYPATAAELAAPLVFNIAMRGGAATRVEGRARDGELVLHAAIASVIGGGPALPGETIQSATSQRIRDFTTVTQSAEYAGDCAIQDLAVTVDVRHTCPSDLRVSLRSPSGATATLHNHASRRLGPRTFALSDSRTALSRFVGESARGRWEVTVRDDVDADVGSFESFSIRFTCGAGGVRTTSATDVPRGGFGASGALAGGLGGGRRYGSGVLNPWATGNGPRAYPPPPPPVVAGRPQPNNDQVLSPWEN